MKVDIPRYHLSKALHKDSIYNQFAKCKRNTKSYWDIHISNL